MFEACSELRRVTMSLQMTKLRVIPEAHSQSLVLGSAHVLLNQSEIAIIAQSLFPRFGGAIVKT